MIVTGDGGELINPYDGDPNTHKWIGELEPPQKISFTLDLGEGNEIDPDSMRFTKPTYSLVMDFKAWASNNNEDWILLLDVVGLVSNGFSQMTYTLQEQADTEPPTKPLNLSLISASSSTVSIQWDASTDNHTIAGYEIFLDNNLVDTCTLTNYLLTELAENTNYNLYVRAFDEAGNYSSNSDTLTVQTQLIDLEAPSDPSNLVLDSAKYDKLYFSWNAATDNISIAAYLVYLNGNIAGLTKTNSYCIPGLEPDSLYTISISARDASGNVSSGQVQSQFSTSDEIPGRMPIGTNFWNLGWGGSESDPFKTGHQSFELSDNPWKQEFLDETRFYSHFRYMDYMETNHSPLSHWLERTAKDYYEQNPMAFEWMIHLCNTQHTDLWITVPHKVVSRNGLEGGDNHFMMKLAILVKTGVDMNSQDMDGLHFSEISLMSEAELLALGGVKTCDPLDPDLKFYLEYSNETWNGSFSQFQYCIDEGTALGLSGDQYAKGRKFHAWAALRLFETAEDVFGVGNPRIIKIDAYQAVVPSQISDHYTVYKNTSLNPREIYPDAFAPAPYFGNGLDGSSSTIENDLIHGNSGILARAGSLEAARDILDNEIAKGFPVDKLIAYEAGQHVVINADVICRKEVIYDLYIQYLDNCNRYLDEMSHYLHSGRFSSGGAWGSKESIGQDISNAHKYRALYQWSQGTETRPEVPASDISVTFEVKDISDNSLIQNAEVTFNSQVQNTNDEGIVIYIDQTAGTSLPWHVIHDNYSDASGTIVNLSNDTIVEVFMDSNVGIENTKNRNLLYPNPCRDLFTLNYTSPGALAIFDLSGICLKNIEEYSGEMIDIYAYEPGAYIVKFINEETTITGLLVKE